MFTKIKDKISRIARRALGIDGLRSELDLIKSSTVDKLDLISHKLHVITNKLDVITNKLDVITNKLAELDPKAQNLVERSDSLYWQTRHVSDGLDRLKSFLTWSANRVEPWLPAESFTQTEPDYDLAGFVYNFLPNRLAVDVGALDAEYAKALSAIGYQVSCFPATIGLVEKLRNETANLPRIEVLDCVIETAAMPAENTPANAGFLCSNINQDGMPREYPQVTTIASLVSSGILPAQIDLMKIDTGDNDLKIAENLALVRPAVVQIEFSSEELVEQQKGQVSVLSASEKIEAMRELEYYWNIIIFRADSEDFVRMATNLGATPKQTWGKIFFFRDHQLFLKTHHWCKGALPRFRAAALPNR